MKISNIINHIFGDSLLKNSIYMMATNFLGSILAFLFWIIATRYYTPSDIGITSAIFSSVSLVSMIGSLGLSRAIIFYLPRDKNAGKIINSCMVTNVISSIIFSSIFIFGLKIWAPELVSTLNSLENVLIFIVVTVATSISVLIGSALMAGRRSSFQMVKETTYHFIKIFPLILLTGFGAIGILMSIFIGLVLSIIVGFVLLSEVWKYSPKIILDPIIKDMASFSIGNYALGIFYSLPILILPIMILNTISAKSAGHFYIAIMIASLLYGVLQSVSSSLLVESSDEKKFDDNINKSIKFDLMILIPGVLFFTIFGRLILGVFSPEYAESATMAMIILVATSIPMSLINIFVTVRNVQGRVFSAVKLNILLAFITIMLSTSLVRSMGIEGAAISYLIANIIGALIVIYNVKNPKEFTMRLLNDVKSNMSHNF